jgi:Tfp pilus assembly protein PilO
MEATMNKIKDGLIVPVAIPAWQAILLVCSIVFGAGKIVNQLEEMTNSNKKYEQKLDVLFERQITNINNIAHIQDQLGGMKEDVTYINHRLTALESKVIKP